MGHQSKTEMLETLRGLVREALRMRREGAVHHRLARAGGAVDGYLGAMVDAGVATRGELLALVSEERAKMDGPATGTARTELDSSIAA